MNTSVIIEHEVISLIGLSIAVGFVWGNVLYVIAVGCLYVGFQALYWRTKFKKVIVKTEETTKASVWGDVITTCHSDLTHPERDE